MHAGEAVKLKRVEVVCGITGLRMPRLHLRFGLQLHIAQLGAQVLQVATHFFHGRAKLGNARFKAGAAAGDLASLPEHAVQNLGAHAYLLLAARLCRQMRSSGRSYGSWLVRVTSRALGSA